MRRDVIAAAVAGVIIGAVATAALMSRYTRGSAVGPVAELDRGTRGAPGVNPDDVVAVLDADRPAPSARAPERAVAAPRAVDPSVPTMSAGHGDVIEDLKSRRLTVPVQGIAPSQLVQTFKDPRSGSRVHEAIDILAPRNTPVLAVEDGKVARLFMSKAGGITLYQYDPSDKYVYYYAHLERYADNLKEGAEIRRGQVLGYVGTSGNAPPNTPHLHFAIFETTEPKRWWEGTPIDPFLVLR